MLACASRILSWSIGVALLSGCGANVVFESGGEGGSAGAGASSPGGGSEGGSTSSGSPCGALTAAFEDAISAARACDPFLNVASCTGSAVILDSCGCPAIVANELYPERVEAAKNAYDAWVGAGCGPFPCETCVPANAGICDSVTSQCEVVTPL